MASQSNAEGIQASSSLEAGSGFGRSPERTSEVEQNPLRNRDRLTTLASELLDQIFREVYLEKGHPGLICSALVPFQRRQYRSIVDKDWSGQVQLDKDRLKQILAAAVSLEVLQLDTYPYNGRRLSLLFHVASPSKLKELRFSGDVDAGEGEKSGTSPFAFPAFLGKCTNLTSLTIAGEYPYFDDRRLLPAIRQLPHLSHLTLGDGVTISYKTVKSLINGSKRLDHLSRLTLDMFSNDNGGRDGYECCCDVDIPNPRDTYEDSWKEFWEFEWPEGWSPKRVKTLCKQAKQQDDNSGLCIDGDVPNIVDLQRDYKEGLETLQEELKDRGQSSEDDEGWGW